MDTRTSDFYALGSLQVDVNPLMMKDTDLSMCTNFYTPKYGAKKVRFGYTKFLDTIDNQPVRNLYYYSLPNGTKGIFRYSNKKLYNYKFTGSTWDTAVQTRATDNILAFASLNGSVPYVHFTSNDGYYTYDGTSYVLWSGLAVATPAATYIAAWQSRIFADLAEQSLIESAISFNLNPGYTVDPFYIDNNDPAGGGFTTIDAGNNGSIVGMTSSIDRVQIYKQTGIYRFNGQSFMKLPYFGNILDVVSTRNNTDYILATNGIYLNNGNSISLASFGVQNIIKDTLRVHGISNPVSYSLGDYTIFYIGDMRISGGDNPVDISHGCLVHHEQYNEWYVWDLGHEMTSFGSYLDPTSNEPVLMSGDVDGNTYVWGEDYFSDDGISIPYHLRTKYFTFSSPANEKIPEMIAISTGKTRQSNLGIATDYTDVYKEQRFTDGKITINRVKKVPNFHSISLEMFGSTSSDRPEINGFSLAVKDNDMKVTDDIRGS